ncbi:Notchless protein 1, partial [Gonapodya sp. JEL0774]
HAHAVSRYTTLIARQPERLLSCSDDFTLFLWDPSTSSKPIARLTGHQQPVTGISFSPDSTFIASASFDGSVKLWHGATGKFLRSMRGHVGPVFCVTFSPDGRMVASGSRDSTVKVWDAATGKMKAELPGHADEVYGVDWAPGSGERVASGGKDGAVKM